MSINLDAEVRSARAAESEGGRTITPNEAAGILSRARAENISESRLRRALGRAYEAPLASAIDSSGNMGVGRVGVSAGSEHVVLNTTLSGVRGEVTVSFDTTAGATDRLRELAFAALVRQMYGIASPGDTPPGLLSSPALAPLRAEYDAAVRDGGSHTFRFPPALTRAPE